ncbi:unnamed protein product [Haemonchus placei]|uniref:PDZ domain-containing protein n=1 Tax=Haemonchus placei TaxID=6290 RepID=A0A0N4WIP6_HAEPC|nr:unnamed protein product [Haemonchus placei]
MRSPKPAGLMGVVIRVGVGEVQDMKDFGSIAICTRHSDGGELQMAGKISRDFGTSYVTVDDRICRST